MLRQIALTAVAALLASSAAWAGDEVVKFSSETGFAELYGTSEAQGAYGESAGDRVVTFSDRDEIADFYGTPEPDGAYGDAAGDRVVTFSDEDGIADFTTAAPE